MRMTLLALLAVVSSRGAAADEVQVKDLFSAGGSVSRGGAYTISSVLGDILAGKGSSATAETWSGFYSPLFGALVDVDHPAVASVSWLRAPHPNPPRIAVSIEFSLATADRIQLDVYDLHGRRVKKLRDEHLRPGVHQASWDLRTDRGVPVPNGIYFIRFRTRTLVQTERLAVVH